MTLDEVTTVSVANNTPIAMTSIDKIDDYTYRLNVSNVVESGINNILGDIKISITKKIKPAEYQYIDMEEKHLLY